MKHSRCFFCLALAALFSSAMANLQVSVALTRDVGLSKWNYSLSNSPLSGLNEKACAFTVYINIAAADPAIDQITTPAGWQQETDFRTYISWYAADVATSAQMPGPGQTLTGFSFRNPASYSWWCNTEANSFDEATQAEGTTCTLLIEGPCNVPVGYVNSFQVTEGDLFYGDLQSLAASDSSHLSILNNDMTLVAEVILDGTFPAPSPNALALVGVVSGLRPGLVIALSEFDFTAGIYRPLSGFLTGPNEQVFSINLDCLAFGWVGSGGAVRAKLNWSPLNDEDPVQDGWLNNVDLLHWLPKT